MPRPLIGITCDILDDETVSGEASYIVRRNYAQAVYSTGGQPVLLGYEADSPSDLLEDLDGVLVTGSTPGVSEQKGRTEFEQALIRNALEVDAPILGVCNGMQNLGIVLGGSLYDLREEAAATHIPFAIPDRSAHDISVRKGTLLYRLAGNTSASVNSFHRQAIREDGEFLVSASAADGTVEAIEVPDQNFCLGTQWHPEYLLSPMDQGILSSFIKASRGRADTSSMD